MAYPMSKEAGCRWTTDGFLLVSLAVAGEGIMQIWTDIWAPAAPRITTQAGPACLEPPATVEAIVEVRVPGSVRAASVPTSSPGSRGQSLVKPFFQHFGP